MSFRDSLAISVTPVLLRLALGITFVWAGAGKVLETMPVKGEQAAVLANMGALTPGSAPAFEEKPKAAEPARSDTGGSPPALMQTTTAPSVTASPAQALSPAPKYSAGDFPNPVSVRRLYGIALVIHAAAHPPADADGKAQMALWPANASRGMWPSVCAWAVAITELLGGMFCLVGLFTRLSALGLAGTMLGAMWLTVIGPAIQSGSTRFGFLPTYPAFGMEWKDLFWQFALFMSALGVFFSGPGTMAFDCLLFPRSLPVSKPRPAAPAPAPKPAA